MLLEGRTAGEYQRELEKHLRRSMSLSMCLSQAMIANAGRIVAPYALSSFPNLMRWVARSTRIPRGVLAAEPAN
jgi:hypothetical protein